MLGRNWCQENEVAESVILERMQHNGYFPRVGIYKVMMPGSTSVTDEDVRQYNKILAFLAIVLPKVAIRLM